VDQIYYKYLNENNIWIIIEFLINKYTSHDQISLSDSIKFSTVFEKLINKLFVFLKEGKIGVDEFENLTDFLKNYFFFKVFLKVLCTKILENDDNIYNYFEHYFGGFFYEVTLLLKLY
jgi:hypothetical protein